MKEKEREIIEALTKAMAMMTEEEQERLASFGQGMLFSLERRKANG